MLKTKMRTLKLTLKLMQCLIAATGNTRIGPINKSPLEEKAIAFELNTNAITINVVQCDKLTNALISLLLQTVDNILNATSNLLQASKKTLAKSQEQDNSSNRYEQTAFSYFHFFDNNSPHICISLKTRS